MLENVQDLLEKYCDERLVQLAVQGLAAAHPVETAVYTLEGKRLWASSAETQRFPVQAEGEKPLGLSLKTCRDRNRSMQGTGNDGLCLAPIAILEGPIGFLAAAPVEGGNVPQRLLTALEVCGAFLGEALVGRRTGADLAAELADRYEELSLVYALTEAMDISKNEQEALETIGDAVAQTLGADLLILMVPRLSYAFYYPPPAEEGAWTPLAKALFMQVQESPRTTAVNYLAQSDIFAKVAAPFAHVVATPLEVDGDLGMLALLREDPEDRLYMGHVKMLEAISRQLGIFLTNRKIISARKQLFDLTIFGLARLAESRDIETGEHLERVSSYCRILAEYALEHQLDPAVTPQFVETIFSSSPLHDIGKVGIPDAILNKPGKLTPEEFDLMKLHSNIGGDTLRDIEQRLNWGESTFLTMGKEIAYSHHEKWDGSGYPLGLSGTDIPFAGRIMAVADVYDALTSKRCYKEAMAHETASKIIVEGRGKHFDPQLVDAFLACEEEFIRIRGEFHGAGAEFRERSRFLKHFTGQLMTAPELKP
jgi:HD-GYP domain-containing protein (c-di-GMP phosphodiesterase class II)